MLVEVTASKFRLDRGGAGIEEPGMFNDRFAGGLSCEFWKLSAWESCEEIILWLPDSSRGMVIL
jgi:hypothetical protein